MFPVRRAALPNGLGVLLLPLPASPVATLWAWYRVGSRNEVPGLTGLSHWVEHMLFKGTPTYPREALKRLIEGRGGSWNAFTWKDYTAYFETLPSEHIGVAPKIEADRMRNALFAPDHVRSERTVIIAEREGYENYPEVLLGEEIDAVAYTLSPYRNAVIGWKPDLERIERDDLYQHYQTYYVPNNAIVVAVGGFDPDEMLAQVEDAFGAIPAGPAPPPVRVVEPPQQSERRAVLQRPGAGTSYVQISHRAPRATDPLFYPVLLLDAVLSGGKGLGLVSRAGVSRSSRLYRALVESGLASEATSSYGPAIDETLFDVTITVRSGIAPEQAEAAAVAELRRLQDERVADDELAKAKKQVRAQVTYAGDGVWLQAAWIGASEVIGGPEFLPAFLERIEAVDAGQVQRAAQQAFEPHLRTTGWFLPEPGGTSAVRAEAAMRGPRRGVPARPHYWYARDTVRLPISDETVAREALDGGLVVLAHRNPATPSASLQLIVRAGSEEDRGEAGMARFAAAALQRGTRRRDSATIARELDEIGATLAVRVDTESAALLARCLAEDLPRVLDLAAEIVREPAFDPAEVERVRGELLTSLREDDQDTRRVAERVFRRLAYPPGHPYHYEPEGREATYLGATPEALAAFHHRAYRPSGAILAVAGDVPAGVVVESARGAFARWSGPGVAERVIGRPPFPAATVRDETVLPGKFEASFVIGVPGIPRSHADYYRAAVANMVLGQIGIGGRVGGKVREEMGLAYYAYSSLQAGRIGGAWTIRAGVNVRNLDVAIEASVAELRRLATTPPPPDELRDAQEHLVGSLALQLENNGGIAGMLAFLETHGLGLDHLRRYPELIRTVTPEQVSDVLTRHFPADQVAIGIARPEG